MQNALDALIPTDRLPSFDDATLAEVRDVVARAVNRRMAGRCMDDRENVRSVAVLRALGKIASDGADPRDAAALSAYEAVQRWIQDTRENLKHETVGGDAFDLDSSGRNALGVATLAPAPDHETVTTAYDTYEVAMRTLAIEEPNLYGAVCAWLNSAESTERAGGTGTLKGMLAKSVRAGMPEHVQAALVRFATESLSLKRAGRWTAVAFVSGPACVTCSHETCRTVRNGRTETVRAARTVETVRTVSGPFCPLRPALRTRNFVRGVLPHEEQTAPMFGAPTAGTLALAYVSCGHASCDAARATETVSTFSAGRAVNLRDQSASGTASPVVVRRPLSGPACQTCQHETCETVRAGRYSALTDNERGVLGLTKRTESYAATRTDRAADDWAYVTTPVGPVRAASTRGNKKGSGALGTSATVRGARHAWSERSDKRN